MVSNVLETERLILRRFGYDKFGNKLDKQQRKIEVFQIFKSWSNPQNYRYNEITWDIDDVDEMFDYDFPTSWDMYYMIAESKESGEIIATCRFGKYHDDETNLVWDFGYNVFRGDDKESYTLDDVRSVFDENGLVKDEKYWGKGYAKEILNLIMKIAKSEGIHKLYSGADIDNFASIKAMIKNGFIFSTIDEDGDPCMEYDLLNKRQSEMSKEEIDRAWENYLITIAKEKKNILDKVQENYINQYSSALAFYFLRMVSENESNQNIANDIKKLSEFEVRIMLEKVHALEQRWRKRLDSTPGDIRLNRHIGYCSTLEKMYKRDIATK